MNPMLKIAFDHGYHAAIKEAQIPDSKMQTAQTLGGIGAGTAGALGGGLLGKYLGEQAGKAYGDNVDPEKAKLIGTLAGGALGGGLLGYAGTQVPKMFGKGQQPAQQESALGVAPGMGGDYYDPYEEELYNQMMYENPEAFGLSPVWGSYGGY
jgi:hypothetical protein